MLILVHGIFFLLLEIEGIQGKGVGGWLPAHATFYGASQNPTSLGKLIILNRFLNAIIVSNMRV